MRFTVYKSTFSSANRRGANSTSDRYFILLTRLAQRCRNGGPGSALESVYKCVEDAACRTISRFLYPCGRQPFVYAGHCCPALATYPRVHRSGPLLLSYLVLLRVGFALPTGLLRPRCALRSEERRVGK